MASGAIAIATRGMIFFCPQEEQLISFDKPQLRQALEVRPRIRTAETLPAGAISHPAVVATIELRPTPIAVIAPVPPTDDSYYVAGFGMGTRFAFPLGGGISAGSSMKPIPVVAINLRPIIKKIEEE